MFLYYSLSFRYTFIKLVKGNVLHNACLVLNHKYNRFVFACLLLQAAKTISLGFMNDVLIGIS